MIQYLALYSLLGGSLFHPQHSPLLPVLPEYPSLPPIHRLLELSQIQPRVQKCCSHQPPPYLQLGAMVYPMMILLYLH